MKMQISRFLGMVRVVLNAEAVPLLCFGSSAVAVRPV